MAELEAKIILFYVIKNFRIEKVEGKKLGFVSYGALYDLIDENMIRLVKRW